MKLVWQRFPADRGTVKLVLMALADHAHNADGSSCYPSLNTLAFYAGCKISQARRCVRELQGLEVVEALTRGGGAEGRHYRLDVEAIKRFKPVSEVWKERRQPLSTDGKGTPATDGKGTPAISGTATPSIGARDPYHLRTSTPSTHGSQAFKRRTSKGKPLKARERATSSLLPLDFAPSIADSRWLKGELQQRKLAATIGDVDAWSADVTQAFRLDRRSKKKRSADWSAEWRLWMLREFRFVTQRMQGNGKAARKSRREVSGDDYGPSGDV